jgi:hypothetical protein
VTKPVLQVIIGSTRPGRVGRPVADWIIERARARGDIPFVREKLDEDGRLKPNEIMEQAAGVMLDELARYAEALRPLRSSAPGPT